MTTGPAAWERMLASMRAFFAGVPRRSGGHTLERDGVLAAVTPAVPERSLPNSVVYASEASLAAALDGLAAVYDEAGVLAWTVWVPEHHRRARELLARAGHRLDATPTAMVAALETIEPPRAGDPEPAPDPTLDELGEVNDLAFDSGDAFRRMAGSGPADRGTTYVARERGRAVSVVGTLEHAGDLSIWWVATVPDARGRGLAAGLMRRALADGRERGLAVSTLQATKLGRPVYEQLGYQPLGTIEMWERRRAPRRARPAPRTSPRPRARGAPGTWRRSA